MSQISNATLVAVKGNNEAKKTRRTCSVGSFMPANRRAAAIKRLKAACALILLDILVHIDTNPPKALKEAREHYLKAQRSAASGQATQTRKGRPKGSVNKPKKLLQQTTLFTLIILSSCNVTFTKNQKLQIDLLRKKTQKNVKQVQDTSKPLFTQNF